MSDVMPNVADGIATVVHNVPQTATMADVRPPCDEHVGMDMYAWVVDRKTTLIKGATYFKFSSEVLNRASSKM